MSRLPGEAAQRFLTVADLKPIAVELSVRTNGTKGQLIDRILAVDSTPVEGLVRHRGLLVCSDACRELIAARKVLLGDATRLAKARIEELLAAGDAATACKTYTAYARAWRVEAESFRKDDMSRMAAILAARPESLHHLDEQAQARLRAKAAISKLWKDDVRYDYENGGETADDATEPPRVDEEDERWIRHILFNVEYHESLMFRHIDEDDVIRITSSGGACPACRARTVGPFNRSNLPELPAAGCTSLSGCPVDVDCNFHRESRSPTLPRRPTSWGATTRNASTPSPVVRAIRVRRWQRGGTSRRSMEQLRDGDLVTVDGHLGIVTVGPPEFDLELA